MPWYAKRRERITVRSGRPTSAQWRRTILAAVSIALAAARAEEDRWVGDRRQLGHALGEADGRLVRVVAEDVVRRERPELIADGVGDLRAPVADVREPEPGGRVEVLASVGVPGPGTLALGEDDGLLVVIGDAGKEEFLMLGADARSVDRFGWFHGGPRV